VHRIARGAELKAGRSTVNNTKPYLAMLQEQAQRNAVCRQAVIKYALLYNELELAKSLKRESDPSVYNPAISYLKRYLPDLPQCHGLRLKYMRRTKELVCKVANKEDNVYDAVRRFATFAINPKMLKYIAIVIDNCHKNVMDQQCDAEAISNKGNSRLTAAQVDLHIQIIKAFRDQHYYLHWYIRNYLRAEDLLVTGIFETCMKIDGLNIILASKHETPYHFNIPQIVIDYRNGGSKTQDIINAAEIFGDML
jgi:hypothetical protein